ncbi:hypothetical protein [Nocardia aurantiaca]|uniref:Uncharacterized protein n=1 Tax=Nocardia aurantiaca TaxID=2675850 RepID=A0A6I3LCA9_9NOCA|nr:hypothetical protein [Nocardia aurantiaca]MTE17469.1 hypothetical protein [Nocardia aurantiaca]
MFEPTTWSSDPAENTAIENLGLALHAMAESLHRVVDAQYLDPAGGFDSLR